LVLKNLQLTGFSITKKYPSIDCAFLNAGTLHRFDFSNPGTLDLEAFNHEMTINFTSFVALTHALLPHLLAHNKQSSLIFTGSQVSLVPAFVMPAYSASKAALDAFIMCLREQLRDTNVQVLHISPGPIQTDMNVNFGISLKEFVDETYAGLVERTADIFPGCVGGSTKDQIKEIVETRNEAIARLSKVIHSFN
jgi:short-subunit dehydrogenase involved in D-alanine esterification of teichoic acids